MRDDPYSFVTTLLGYFLGTQLGNLIGPHMLIVVCSASGAMIALGRRDKEKRPAGWQFIFVVVVGAFCLTSMVAAGLAHYFDWIEDSRTIFAPVAFALGFVGLDWDDLLPYLWGKYLQLRGLPARERDNG